jgi:hypothetical protein
MHIEEHIRLYSFTLGPVTNSIQRKRKRKGSAGSDDTASMIMGGGYLGARTRRKQ